MFDLDKALAAWRRSLSHRRALLPDDLAELEQHVRDQVDDLMQRGFSAQDAFERAMREMGDHGSTEAAYREVYWGKLKRTGTLLHQIMSEITMLNNYLKIALRNLLRHKGYTAINVTGLAVGIVCCLFMLLYVRDELSYDRFHAHADRIYRVGLEAMPAYGVDQRIAITPPIVAPLLARTFPEVERAARLMQSDGVVRYEDRVFQEDRFFFGDATVFQIFSFPFLRGDPATALAEPNTVVLTASTARRYFGDEDPLGRTILFNNDRTYEVTGVVEDVPANAHFRFDFMASYASLGGWAQRETWGSANYYTYLLLRPGVDAGVLDGKIQQLLAQRLAEGDQPRPLFLQPLTDIHLYASLAYDLDTSGDISYVYLFSGMALLVLLIACVNYMNLATARSARRALEVGMRKVLGATRRQLARQFYGESVLLALLGVLLALVLAAVTLPLFNALSGKAFTLSILGEPFLWTGLLGIVLVVSLVAGSYPALFLSAFRPVRVLKGAAGQAGGARLRRGLVIVQFGISIFLIAGTFVVRNQLAYLQQTNLGFDKAHTLVLPIDDAQLRREYPALKEAFLQHTGVRSASAVNQYPSALGWTSGVAAEGLPEDVRISMKGFITDTDVVETLGLELIAGRDLPDGLPHPDSLEAGYRYLLNETAVRTLGWTPETAIGKRFNMLGGREGVVLGVVRDFHYASLHDAIEPLAVWYHPDQLNHLLVRIAPTDVAGTMDFLEARWAAMAPHRPFTYRFLDDAFDALYRNEQQMSYLFGVFALLAILIACLGLFGLASFMAEQRTKEIGVRKVLGASAPQIVLLLSRDFARLVLIAFVLAAPAAYLATNRWLEAFAYRIDLSWGVFLLTGLAALGVALLTVSYQALRAALTDPARALRYE